MSSYDRSPVDSTFTSITERPAKKPFSNKDTLVLFGELFQRGYANGLVEEAQSHGMKIVRSTVGRRDEAGQLRKLNEEEASKHPAPFINVPLEAGFDMEPDQKGMAPNDYLKGVKLSDWDKVELSQDSLDFSAAGGEKRFRQNVRAYLKELEVILEPQIAAKGHVHFAHLMAGGVPRTKIVMPLMNRVFKGTGERHLSSKQFMDSSIGRFLLMNFEQVTAKTFDILVEESTALREKIIKAGGSVSYVAYGYHGTEVIIDGKYKWQSYAPYIQGWAKVKLEDFSKAWTKKGVNTCVYNSPEILTNSSSIFQGLEIPLYNLVRSLEKEIPDHPLTKKMRAECNAVLKNPEDLNTIFKMVDEFMAYSEKIGTSKYQNWPQHSVQEQLEKSLALSNSIIEMHKDENQLMTAVLSEIIFKSCGYVMLHDGYKPMHPVSWIGHDLISRCVL